MTKPRVWVWRGPADLSKIAWIAELEENRYLRGHDNGQHSTYESPISPAAGMLGHHWEELE